MFRTARHGLLAALLFTLTCAASPAFAAKSLVVTSIKPVALLTQAIAGGEVETQLLLPPGASPHTYQLRPTDRQLLASAGLIVWIGPDVETFLQKLLANDEFSGRVMGLSRAIGLASHGSRGAHKSSESLDQDPHTWLDPDNIPSMARALAERLKALPGANKSALDRNLQQFLSDFSAQDKSLRQRFASLGHVSLFAYHDAFRRYANSYDLPVAGVLTLNPERAPGARHLAELQSQLRKATNPCLLTEPQFSSRWWQTLISSKIAVVTSVWDPLGTDIAPGPEGFLRYEQAMADAVIACARRPD